MRGRVIARDGERALVRTADAEVWIDGAGAAAPGDLVAQDAGGSLEIARRYSGGDYPGPATEVARLPRRRIDRLRARARAMAAVRDFFGERGFLEVETPVRVPAPGLEVQLRAVRADGAYLITSPEYQMKRLLAAGLERIFTVCKCFRAGEDGPHHGVEFTMLEWYRGFSGVEAIAADTEALVAEVARAVTGGTVVEVGGRRVDLAPPWPRITVAEAMSRFAGVSIRGDEDATALAEILADAGIDTGAAAAWDDLFYTAFVARVEPALAALGRPVFLVDWPVRLAALARRKPGDPAVVERVEAYAGGLELANGFGELTDAEEQRARFLAEQAERAARGLAVTPIDERFLAALAEGLPPSAGIALGLDRLAMLVTGAAEIRDVLAFAGDEL